MPNGAAGRRRRSGRKTCCKPWRGQARLPKRMPFSPSRDARDHHRRRHRGDADPQLRHRRVRHAGQPARQRPVRHQRSTAARATIGATTTLSELQAQRRARLPVASARRHRLADRPQHGDRRRQSVRQAALWRPRRLPDRARRDGVDFRAVGQRAASRSKRPSPPRSGRGEIVTGVSFALPAAGTFKFRKAARKAFNSAAIVTVAAVVSVSGGKVAECRIGARRRRRLGGPRAVGREGADRQAARPRQRRGGGSRGAPRHRARRRCLCQRLVPRPRDAGAHPPRPARRIEHRSRATGRQP